MKAIVCGAGQVGTVITQYLSDEKFEVVLIDTDGRKLTSLENDLDIQTIQGNAANPAVLETAGAKDADMLIAVTNNDEVNMITCLASDALFHVPMKMARLRSGFYLDPDYEQLQQALHMDVVIAPEQEIAKRIVRNLKIPGALDYITLNSRKVVMLGLPLPEKAPLVGRRVDEIKELLPDHVLGLGRVIRDGQSIPITNSLVFQKEDDVYFVAKTKGLSKVLSVMGHETDVARKVILFGGGRVGLRTAKLLEEEGVTQHITLVEKDERRAHFLAKQLPDTLIIKGDGLSEDILNESQIGEMDVSIALTGEDEDNILLSLLAKRKNVKKTFALINKALYNHLISDLGVDVIIDPNAISISTIIAQIRKGQIRSVYSLGSGVGDVMEIAALETSKVVGIPFEKIKTPSGVRICAVVRDGELMPLSKDFEIMKGDSVIVFADKGHSKEVDKLFAAGLFFF